MDCSEAGVEVKKNYSVLVAVVSPCYILSVILVLKKLCYSDGSCCIFMHLYFSDITVLYFCSASEYCILVITLLYT